MGRFGYILLSAIIHSLLPIKYMYQGEEKHS